MEEYTIKSVDKALHLLEAVSEYPNGVAMTELAQRLGMNKSTVHHLLATLVRRGYMQQDETTAHYKLGYSVLDLGMRMLSALDLRRESYAFLRELAQHSNEVVHLAVLDRAEVVYIEKVEGQHPVRMYSRVGKRVPVHATGLGKAILAFLPQSDTARIIAEYGLPAVTPYTITEGRRLLETLEEVRKLGYAIDAEENEAGICCIAAPIFDHRQQVVAACSVSAPCMRMDPTCIQALTPYVMATSLQISERLGDMTHAARNRK